MAGWMNRMTQFLNLWVIRIAVISSFAAHLVLILFAGIRRRKASGGRTLLLWLAYQLADWAATYALGNLSLGSTSREQQLVAFWAPFLLLHLGGPDNISAYSLEDNILSGRQVLNVSARVTGAFYVLYKHIYTGGSSGTLLPASIIIFAVGVAKYVERALALRQGHLGNIRSSSQKQQPSRFTTCSISEQELDNEQALLVAHNLFHFCRRAMVDSSVDTDSPDHDTSRKILSLEWKDMCKVVEMELSLMYDILYTKAAMVHTWGGYLIRFISPLATAAAFLLFWLYGKDGQRRADVVITYALLGAAFLLDMRWLLRALGSTWTHAFLHARPRCWLHHAVLCTGRWHRLRRVVASLDPHRLLIRAPSSYRIWSGTIGQYNLLHECTRDMTSLRSRLAKKIGLEDGWNEYHYSEGLELSGDVKGLVFARMQKVLKSYEEEATSNTMDENAYYSMKNITTSWGQVAARRRGKTLRKFRLAFGHEFQEDILVWHIATDVFLLCSDQQLIKGKNAAATLSTRVKAIKALSQYLMFLVAVRRYMLPGLVLRSLYEGTRGALQDIWRKGKKYNPSSTTREKLAWILRDQQKHNKSWGLSQAKTRLISDGTALAMTLLSADESDMPEVLELIFNVWVDKLLYAGTRCSRDSHAKQLSRGGELTTIVWILAEHAGPFRIGEFSQKTRVPKEEKKKKADAKPESAPPHPYPVPCSGRPPKGGGAPAYPVPCSGAPPAYPVPCSAPPRPASADYVEEEEDEYFEDDFFVDDFFEVRPPKFGGAPPYPVPCSGRPPKGGGTPAYPVPYSGATPAYPVPCSAPPKPASADYVEEEEDEYFEDDEYFEEEEDAKKEEDDEMYATLYPVD